MENIQIHILNALNSVEVPRLSNEILAGLHSQRGYIEVGDGCWRSNVLVTSFGCW